MCAIKVIIFFATVIASINTKDLPKGFITCSRSDPKFHECLSNSVTQALMLLRNGNAEFNLPSIDPYFIKYIESDTIGGAANFVLKSSIKDMNLIGFGNGVIKKVNTKFGKNNFAIRAEAGNFGNVKLIGQYTMKGNILVLPIDGEGKCNVTMNNPTIFLEMRGKYFEKGNETYMNVTSFEVQLKPKKAQFNFENLFKNDKKLSNTINNFMNQNWELVVENLLPGYEKRLGIIFKDETNKIFNNVPMKKIFRD